MEPPAATVATLAPGLPLCRKLVSDVKANDYSEVLTLWQAMSEEE